MGLAFVIANIQSWDLEDAEAYWNAAMRLRHGSDLYIPVHLGADEMTAYRYAPWFAWIWVPFSFLPKAMTQTLWSIVLLGAVAVALFPLIRQRTTVAWCLFFLLGGLLIRTASTGNVHALVIAVLVWGAPRRSGPFWIGLAASLKIVPLLYVLTYLGRGQWGRVAFALGVTGLLWAPALLFELREYPTEAGDSLSLLSNAGPVPWVALIVACAAIALFAARSRFGWLAASVAVITAVPRLALYDLTYLLAWRGDKREPQAVTTNASN
jgi:hypothetical protein